MHEDDKNFEETLRAMARELGQSVERAMERIDLDDLAGMVGVDPERAREWAQGAGAWLRQQAEGFDPTAYHPGHPDTPAPRQDAPHSPPPHSPSPEGFRPPPDGFPSVGPHTLDLPTEEQGTALAA